MENVQNKESNNNNTFAKDIQRRMFVLLDCHFVRNTPFQYTERFTGLPINVNVFIHRCVKSRL